MTMSEGVAILRRPMAQIIDGKAVAAAVRGEVARAVNELAPSGLVPGLAVVRVGDDPASAVYVRGKRKDSEEVGFRSVEHHLPASATQAEILAVVAKLNADALIHGILVQLPLPKGVDERAVLEAIDPRKDADGFHPYNVGSLSIGLPDRAPAPPPASCGSSPRWAAIRRGSGRWWWGDRTSWGSRWP